MPERQRALLTIDLEDYRSIRLRAYSVEAAVEPAELTGEIESLLELLESIDASATFFSVGGLASDLSSWIWAEIAARHTIGAHSFSHRRVTHQGSREFSLDLRRTKEALEDASGRPVVSYRAPYFSGHRCHPWFGEALAREGYVIDSSERLFLAPQGFRGVFPLEGSSGAVTEIPLAAVGVGGKRLTIIGGTYFRLLSLQMIRGLLAAADGRGFLPMVYLHPYDLNRGAPPIEVPAGHSKWSLRAGDWMRNAGRSTAAEKLRALSDSYRFEPVESLLGFPIC